MNWYKTLKLALVIPKKPDQTYMDIGHEGFNEGGTENIEYIWTFFKGKLNIVEPEEYDDTHDNTGMMDNIDDSWTEKIPYGKGRVSVKPDGSTEASMYLFFMRDDRQREYFRQKIDNMLNREFGTDVKIIDYSWH